MPERGLFARALRAALRQEVVRLKLSDAPDPKGAFTLELDSGQSRVRLVAEVAGAMLDGAYPLRLRPATRAQFGELFTMLEQIGPGHDSSPPELGLGPASESVPDAFADTMVKSPTHPPAPKNSAAEDEEDIPELDSDMADPSISIALVEGAEFDDLDGAIAAFLNENATTTEAAEQHPLVAIPDIPDLPPLDLPPDDDGHSIDTSSLVGSTMIALAPGMTPAAPAPVVVHPPPAIAPVAAARAPEKSQPIVRRDSPTPAQKPEKQAPIVPREPLREAIPRTDRTEKGPPPNPRESPLPNAVPRAPDSAPASIAKAAAPVAQATPAPSPQPSQTAPKPAPTPQPKSSAHDDDDDALTLIRLPIGEGGEVELDTAWDAPTPTLAELAIDIDEATINKKAPDGVAPPRDPLLGRGIAGGKYTVESLVGSGATGAVYKANHRDLRRTVAIKVLHPHYQNDLSFMKRFHGEALAASQLDHPNIMRVMDFGQEQDGLVYIVMEFLSGISLQQMIKEQTRLPKERAISIMMQVCAALQSAHEQGIVHRDVKPDNIVLVPSRDDENRPVELVKVCDFGIAALQNTRTDELELSNGAGYICGTPEYMAPEQARGESSDARSDVYACGCTLYEVVTGRTPFMSDNPLETIVRHAKDAVPAPSTFFKEIDPLLEEVMLKSLAKDPAQRQQSARELRTELKELLSEGERPSFADNETSGPNKAAALPLADPQAGFSQFFVAFASAVCGLGPFQTESPQAQAQNIKQLRRVVLAFLRGRAEITFARRDTAKSMGFFVLAGDGDASDLKKLIGSELHSSYGMPFITDLAARGVAALTIRDEISEEDLTALVSILRSHADVVPRAFTEKSRESISALFAPDVIGRDRKLTWKVGLCISRLAKDTALAQKRGLSPRKLKETRVQLLLAASRVLAKPEELRQFLVNADVLTGNTRTENAAQTLIELLPLSRCVDVTPHVLTEFDQAPPESADRERAKNVLSLLAKRYLLERTPESFDALRELAKRKIVSANELPPDMLMSIRAEGLADALALDPAVHLKALEDLHDFRILQGEMAIFKAAMKLLAKRGEASALLATVTALARIARSKGKTPGPREDMALKVMTSVVDKDRLLPTAKVMLIGQPQMREPARQLLILAGSAGAQSIIAAREQLREPSGRAYFVQAMKQTGPHGALAVGAALAKIDPSREGFDLALAEDLLSAMPPHQDPVLAEQVARFMKEPKLRRSALTALVSAAGDRARGLLIESLDSPDEGVRAIALFELGRARLIDESVLAHVEKLLMTRGLGGDALRRSAAQALSFCIGAQRNRAVQILTRTLEGKGGFLSMLRGAEQNDESPAVVIDMARALLVLDRGEGLRIIRARAQKSEGELKTKLTELIDKPPA